MLYFCIIIHQKKTAKMKKNLFLALLVVASCSKNNQSPQVATSIIKFKYSVKGFPEVRKLSYTSFSLNEAKQEFSTQVDCDYYSDLDTVITHCIGYEIEDTTYVDCPNVK